MREIYLVVIKFNYFKIFSASKLLDSLATSIANCPRLFFIFLSLPNLSKSSTISASLDAAI